MRLPLISTGRAISARWTAIRRRPCATPRRGWPTPPNRCSPTSTRTRSTSSRTMTKRERSRPSCRRLPEPAGQRRGRHRRRHGDQHPAAQSGRADRRLLRADRPIPSSTVPQLMRHRAGTGLPDRRHHPRSQRHPGRLPQRAAARSSCGPRPGSRRCAAAANRSSSPRCPIRSTRRGCIERIAEVVRDKRVEGIADLRDESDRDGVRVVIELKRDAMADVVLNQLYRFTPLQTCFGINMRLALRRRSARADEPQGVPRGVHPLPRGGHHYGAPSSSSPRRASRAHRAGRPRHRRRQHRRGDRDDPPRARPGGRARAPDGAGMAGDGRDAVGRLDRRAGAGSRPPTAPTGCPRTRRGPSSSCACSA